MPFFVARYKSPDASFDRAKGIFEFESDSRLGSKANHKDARIKMLELFGNEALQWNIESIEKKSIKDARTDGQLELDFRSPKERRRVDHKKKYW